jgi:predicted nucleic acid-binding protein
VTPVLVDSNVLLDVVTDDATWGAWSAAMLERIADEAILVINALVYAEVSVGFASIEAMEEALPPELYRREPLPFEAAFLAGKAFGRYRAAGGTRASPLPDFYIGAHAAVSGYRLLSRDATRYRTYYPRLELVTPDSGIVPLDVVPSSESTTSPREG